MPDSFRPVKPRKNSRQRNLAVTNWRYRTRNEMYATRTTTIKHVYLRVWSPVMVAMAIMVVGRIAQRMTSLRTAAQTTQDVNLPMNACTSARVADGIMEAANRGAHDVGALSIGLNITLPHEQSGNRFITPSLNFKFHYFALRKMHFMMRAKALVAFPGGMGTLDELFEVLTLVQTRKAQPVPIILFGTEYWKKLIDFDLMVAEGTISKEDLSFFTYTDDPQVAWNTIKTFYKLT